MTAPALVELRRYTLRPGQRDTLIELFEAEFLAPQAAVGMPVLGQFRDQDEPDHFVWLRGFPSDDPQARAEALGAFYYGPVWRAHSEAANDTMLDSDDVMLLRPLRWAPGADGAGAVTATTCLLDRPAQELAAPEDLGAAFAVLVTADVPNAFPRLPVRDGEHALVWLDAGTGATPVPEAIAGHLTEPAHVARLAATERSGLRG